MQNQAIYPELDRIRRAPNNTWVLIRISPYNDVLSDLLALQSSLAIQLADDNETLDLQLESKGKKIYARKRINNGT